jgi:NAD(P)-dependent dehydrogenase (short-subunit alcohol dehydrogenase family)
MKSLEGKTCLITGGGTGIGRATAKRMVEEGANVWILGRRENELQEAAHEIGCQARSCDVTDEKKLRSIIDEIGRLDVAVSNAAVSFPVDPLTDPMERWREMMEVNCWGAVNTCRAAGEAMIRANTGGRIVIVSSILGEIAEPGSTPYGMAKAALNQMGRQLAVEWARHGILVNTVAPGCVRTPMSCVNGADEYESEWYRKYFIDPERPRIPLLRPGTSEEIAEAILFFCLPANSYCTGSVLTVDGGLTIKF